MDIEYPSFINFERVYKMNLGLIITSVLCALIALMFGIVGAHGDMVAMTISFYMIACAILFLIINVVLSIINH